MYEKILSALKTKFNGVPGDLLEKRARKLSETVTKEESVQTAVDGVELGDLFKAYGDSRATSATETAVKNWREKHKLDENGKPIGTGGSGNAGNEGNTNPPPGGDDEPPKWFKGFSTKFEELSSELSGIKAEKQREQRASLIAGKLKTAGIPERLHKRFTVEDEADETAIEAAVSEYKQELNDLGLSGLQEPGKDGDSGSSTEELTSYLDDKFGNNEN